MSPFRMRQMSSLLRKRRCGTEGVEDDDDDDDEEEEEEEEDDDDDDNEI